MSVAKESATHRLRTLSTKVVAAQRLGGRRSDAGSQPHHGQPRSMDDVVADDLVNRVVHGKKTQRAVNPLLKALEDAQKAAERHLREEDMPTPSDASPRGGLNRSVNSQGSVNAPKALLKKGSRRSFGSKKAGGEITSTTSVTLPEMLPESELPSLEASPRAVSKVSSGALQSSSSLSMSNMAGGRQPLKQFREAVPTMNPAQVDVALEPIEITSEDIKEIIRNKSYRNRSVAGLPGAGGEPGVGRRAAPEKYRPHVLKKKSSEKAENTGAARASSALGEGSTNLPPLYSSTSSNRAALPPRAQTSMETAPAAKSSSEGFRLPSLMDFAKNKKGDVGKPELKENLHGSAHQQPPPLQQLASKYSSQSADPIIAATATKKPKKKKTSERSPFGNFFTDEDDGWFSASQDEAENPLDVRIKAKGKKKKFKKAGKDAADNDDDNPYKDPSLMPRVRQLPDAKALVDRYARAQHEEEAKIEEIKKALLNAGIAAQQQSSSGGAQPAPDSRSMNSGSATTSRGTSLTTTPRMRKGSFSSSRRRDQQPVDITSRMENKFESEMDYRHLNDPLARPKIDPNAGKDELPKYSPLELLMMGQRDRLQVMKNERRRSDAEAGKVMKVFQAATSTSDTAGELMRSKHSSSPKSTSPSPQKSTAKPQQLSKKDEAVVRRLSASVGEQSMAESTTWLEDPYNSTNPDGSKRRARRASRGASVKIAEEDESAQRLFSLPSPVAPPITSDPAAVEDSNTMSTSLLRRASWCSEQPSLLDSTTREVSLAAEAENDASNARSTSGLSRVSFAASGKGADKLLRIRQRSDARQRHPGFDKAAFERRYTSPLKFIPARKAQRKRVIRNTIRKSVMRYKLSNIFRFEKKEPEVVEEVIPVHTCEGKMWPEDLEELVERYHQADETHCGTIHVSELIDYHKFFKWRQPPVLQDVYAIREHKSGLTNLLTYLHLMHPEVEASEIERKLVEQDLESAVNRTFWTAECEKLAPGSVFEMHDQYVQVRGKELDGVTRPQFLYHFRLTLPAADLGNLFDAFDVDGDGRLCFYEFAAALWRGYSEAPFPEQEVSGESLFTPSHADEGERFPRTFSVASSPDSSRR